MATFVLVHGAWHGGWCWRKVIPFLEAAGHEVYAPTLTGLAERASELSPEVGLDTHIQDVVGLLKEKVQPLDMVDKSASPFQTPFGPVFGQEAVQTGLLFPA